MINWAATVRRALLVVTALTLAAPLLRTSVASALVTRGDGLLYTRDARAAAMYRRALAIDPGDSVASDRYALSALLSHRKSIIEDGIRVLDLALVNHPEDATLRMDRALCLQKLKRYSLAEPDFERVGMENRNVEALAFAAADARKLSRISKARSLLLVASRIDPKYEPIRLALHGMKR